MTTFRHCQNSCPIRALWNGWRPASAPESDKPKRSRSPNQRSRTPSGTGNRPPSRKLEGRATKGLSPAEGVRLQKIIADAGIASRRAAERLIEEGRVKVNGRLARLGQRAVIGKDRVEVDGLPLHVGGDLVYLMLNKPAGVVTTANDPQHRKTVLDIIGAHERVFPVGRLDIQTEGLLLLTNDGDLAYRLTHPSFEVAKVYIAEVEGRAEKRNLENLVKHGVKVDRGQPAKAVSAKVIDSPGGKGARSLVEVALHEGRKHVVRKMLSEIGHPVLRLVRTGLGPLSLGKLSTGTYRKLTPGEISRLYAEVGL